MDAGTIPVPRGTMIRISIRLPGTATGRGAQLVWMNIETMSLDRATEQIRTELLKRLMSETAK